MDRVGGRVFPDGALPDAPPSERHALWMGLADALGQLHRVRPEAVGLADYGRPGSYFERQLARWSKQWQESTSDPIPELDRLGAWLAENLPADDGAVSLAHGDFRMGNVIFHPTEPRVVAILDWELSTLGHPLADVGFCAMAWHTTPDEYGGILGLDLAAQGLPTEAEFLARYAKANPSVAAPTAFHKAFALFRFAVIFVGIADRAKQGTATQIPRGRTRRHAGAGGSAPAAPAVRVGSRKGASPRTASRPSDPLVRDAQFRDHHQRQQGMLHVGVVQRAAAVGHGGTSACALSATSRAGRSDIRPAMGSSTKCQFLPVAPDR
jgi:hypothetical protein